MNPHASAGDVLVQVADWGDVSIVEVEGHRPVEIQRIAVAGIDLERADAVHALAEKWRACASAAITSTVAVDNVRVPTGGQWIVVEREAPSGSTLSELSAASGALDVVVVATLFLELLEGVAAAHSKGLVFGQFRPTDLFVCPPAATTIAALRVHRSGSAALIAAARGALGNAEDSGFSQVFDELRVIAPEVSDGGAPDAMSDTFSLCCTMAWCFLGQHVFDGVDQWAVRERVRRGASPDVTRQLVELAPGIGQLIARGLSVQPLLRRGVVSELRDAFTNLLGAPRCRRILVREGGDPWGMGSPLIPLAAYVRATPYAQRFSQQTQARRRRASAARASNATQPDSAAGVRPTGAVDEARISTAIAELKILRAQAERQDQRKTSLSVKLVVAFVTVAVALAIAYIGLDRTQQLGALTGARKVAPAKPLPKPPEPRLLYTEPPQE